MKDISYASMRDLQIASSRSLPGMAGGSRGLLGSSIDLPSSRGKVGDEPLSAYNPSVLGVDVGIGEVGEPDRFSSVDSLLTLILQLKMGSKGTFCSVRRSVEPLRGHVHTMAWQLD